MISDNFEKALTEIKNVVNACKVYDAQEGATAKFELLQACKILSAAIQEIGADRVKLTEDQKDQLGMSFYEELFVILGD